MKPTKVILQMADKTVRHAHGIVENVLALYPYWESMVWDSHSVYVETFQVQVQAWKVAKHVESGVCNFTISAECVCGAIRWRSEVCDLFPKEVVDGLIGGKGRPRYLSLHERRRR
ncbi:hypothetical protein PIB30_087672 [Stylosanthes scabra]|uniref:Uncharacterized protein n=1 Tax=Stylosanthes scabra TaxID=79078 RepID=A0ABU6UT12_9FABA|nr:hypothetical protein [Stylosanthes scabra]